MSKILIVGLVAVVTVLGGASMAVGQAISVDLEPVADITIYGEYPDGQARYHAIWAIDSRRRSLVKFELPTDFVGAKVLRADVEMEIERVDDPDTSVSIRRMTHDWVNINALNNPCNPGGGATWNEFDCSANHMDNLWPGGPGALYDSDRTIAIPMTSWRHKERDPNDPSMFISISDPNFTPELPIQPFGWNNLGDFALWDITSIVQQ